ncbi:UNVERIFIED_CONTAM: hypothetical protein GTU68_064201 [Idotea baltica]|nr:hypothetical protein [Idotea baltica]
MPFAGFAMPISYSNIKQEHQAVRENVGIFDVSHMGEFIVSGPDATAFLNYVCSNDIFKLFNGKALYGYLPNNNGGIVDDLLVYRLASDQYLLVVNAANIAKDLNWLKEHKNNFDVRIENHSNDWSLLAVQGPNAAKTLQSLTSIDLPSIEYYTFKIGDFAGIEEVIISATGYTGSGGFEIYMKSKHALVIWDAIMNTEHPPTPCGLAARDTLRLEMGYCLYGQDIDDTSCPLEAGLSWVTSLDKEFIGSAELLAKKEGKLMQRLVGFEMIDRGIPRQGYEVLDAQGNTLGKVTSGTHGPSVNKGIGMAYIASPFNKKNSEIFIGVRNKRLKAKVVKMPFYKV